MENKFAAYIAAMLGAIGKQYTPAKERVRDAWKSFYRPMAMDEHYVDYHGTLHRRDKKRDRTVSARQWKRIKKAARRAVRVQLEQKKEQEACTQGQ